MTGNLIKYEFRSGLRYIGIIWPALIVSAALLGLVFKVMGIVSPEDPQGIMNILQLIFDLVFPLLYAAIFIAMIVITIFIVILRFYKGLLGDEGYLMHTLPVKPWQLITSKGIVACAVVMISIICAVLSVLILVGIDDISGLVTGAKEFFSVLGEEPRLILVIIEVIILAIFGTMASIYHIYAAMAIGQLTGKHRLLASLGAYIAINIALTVLATVIIVIGDRLCLDVWLSEWLWSIEASAGMKDDGFIMVQAGLGAAFVVAVVQLAAFHVITERILSKKLNLI
ncbi:MAG: hypothetical protein IJB54_07345 [Firmicutes bacterium]|nr:hypothetical protein [Bacillota bacterium]